VPYLIAIVVIAVLVAVSIGVRRHGESDDPQLGWTPTEEVFRDPSTDRVMRVWIDPKDGSRHHVPEG
jgi:hypothetical protein